MVILLNKETTGSSYKEGAGKKYSILVPLKKIEYDSDNLGFSLIFNDSVQENLHFRLPGNTLKLNTVDVTSLAIDVIIDKVRDEVFPKAATPASTTALLTGYVKSITNRAISATDTLLAAIGILEKKNDDNSPLTPTGIKVAAYPAAAGELVKTDTTNGVVPITFPSAPADKARIAVKMVTQGGTNATTIILSGSDVFNKAGGSTSASIIVLNQTITFQYELATGIWTATGSDTPIGQLDLRYGNIASIVNVYTKSNLRNVTAPNAGARYFVSNTGEGFNYYYDSADTTSADNNGSILVSSNGKRFKIISSIITPEMFDAVGDGIADDTSKMQAAIDAAFNSAKSLRLGGAKSYYCTSELTVSGALHIVGEGQATTSIRGRSRIVVNSTTQNAITVSNSIANKFHFKAEDFSIENLSSSTPTAGWGLKIGYADSSNVTRVSTINFFDNMKADGGNYYAIDKCNFFDFVNYGLTIANSTNPDEGDMTVTRCNFLPKYFNTRPPVGAVLWNSSGGLRFQNNKINWMGISASKMQYGLNFDIASAVQTSVILIQDNSIENCTQAGTYIHSSFTNCQLGKILITGNEYGLMSVNSIKMDMPANSGAANKAITSALIANNHLSGTTALYVRNTNNLHIGPNQYYVSVACVSVGDDYNLSYEPGSLMELANASGIILFSDQDSTYGNKSIGNQNFTYTTNIPVGSTDVIYMNLYSLNVVNNKTVRVDFEVSGFIEGVGDTYVRLAKLITCTGGAATVSSIGLEESLNASPLISINFLVASGKVTIRVRKASSSAGDLHGAVKLKLHTEHISSIVKEQN